ncbi:hypothetical protein, partial [Streptococcus oralis]
FYKKNPIFSYRLKSTFSHPYINHFMPFSSPIIETETGIFYRYFLKNKFISFSIPDSVFIILVI